MDIEFYIKGAVESISCNFAILKYSDFRTRLADAFGDYLWKCKPSDPSEKTFYFVYDGGILYVFDRYSKGIDDGDFLAAFPDAISMRGSCFFSDEGKVSLERLGVYALALYKQISR